MAAGRLYEFGRFRLDSAERQLFRDAEILPLTPKAVDTLLYLVEHHEHTVGKEELIQKIWPGTFVGDSSLTQVIWMLRKTLGDSAEGHEIIATIPKRGYRFVAQVREAAPAVEPPPAKTRSAEAPEAPRVAVRSRAGARPGWRLAGAALAAGLVLAGYLERGRLWPRASVPPQRIMLAVLPVQNLSGDPEQEYIGDGLTEEMIAQLGSLDPQRLGVIARTSSMSYKNTTKTVEQIARELGVDYVLESSLRGTADRVRITAQLIRTRDQTHLWAHDYDHALRDVVAVQDEVGRAIAQQIQVQLTPEAQVRLARAQLVKANAYQAYLKGRFQWNMRTREGLEKSVEYFEQAVEMDPADARAYSGLADAYNLLVFYGYHRGAVDIINAREAAQRALALDDTLAEAHASAGYVDFMWIWDWPGAEREFRRAIELGANYVAAHHWYALFLSAMGRQREALAEIQIARKIDPLSPIVNTAAGYIQYFGRDNDAAIRECRGVLDWAPNFTPAHAVLGQAYEQKGMYEEAIAEFQKAIQLTGIRPANYIAYLGHAYGISGRRGEAEKILGELDELGKQGGFLGLTSKALVYAGLGEKEQAMQALVDAREQNDAGRIWFRVDPRFDLVRSDPRLRELLPELKNP